MAKSKGFTLIELMIVFGIVAILAAIAYPSYRQAVIKGNRRAAQSAMMEIVNHEHQYFIANRAYADQPALNYALPPDVVQKYTYAIALDAGPPPGFTVISRRSAARSPMATCRSTAWATRIPAEKW